MRKTAKHIFLFFLSTVFLSVSFAQTKDEQIKSIRKKVEVINMETSLKKIVLENEEFLEDMTDNGGKLTGYYKGKEIKKIQEWIGGSNRIEIREFYFDDHRLIFVYEEFNSPVYDSIKNQLDSKKIKTVFEGRYYFDNRKNFNSSIKGDKYLAPQDVNFDEILLERADSNLQLLNNEMSKALTRKLLTGDWISIDDKQYHVVFSDSVKTDFYDGKMTSTSKYKLEKDSKLIVNDIETEHNLEYEIVSLSKTSLTLMYLARGNLLKFKRK